jgi:hypothetical protein
MIMAVVHWAFEFFGGFFGDVGIVSVDCCLGCSFIRFSVVIGLTEILSCHSLLVACSGRSDLFLNAVSPIHMQGPLPLDNVTYFASPCSEHVPIQSTSSFHLLILIIVT